MEKGKALAHIELVQNILPIKDNKKVELIKILGWQVVAKKGHYHVGQHVVYIESGTIVPNRKPFLFLDSNCFKIKTIWLQQLHMYTRGLIFSLNSFDFEIPYKIGTDVTELLGVVRAKRSVCEKPMKTNKFKAFWYAWLGYNEDDFKLPYKINTKRIPEIQNVPFYINSKQKWVVTEKVNGLNVVYILYRFGLYKFHVLNKCKPLKKDKGIYWKCAEKFEVEKKLKILLKNDKRLDWVSIQCEIVMIDCPSNSREPRMFVFNYTESLKRTEPLKTLIKKQIIENVNFKWVPLINPEFVAYKSLKDLDDLIVTADGNSKFYKGAREGLVFTSGSDVFQILSNYFLDLNNL